MKVTVIYLYSNIASDIAFSESIIKKLQLHNDLHIVATHDFIDKCICSIQVEKVWGDSLPANKLDKKKAVNLFDAIYAGLEDNTLGTAVIVPLHNWEPLKYIGDSYLQLAKKHVLFCVDGVPNKDLKEFIRLVEYLDRFRNIHIGIYEDIAVNDSISKIYNLHFLQQENLEGILSLRLNNRRKYIGWKYHLNELRQKIKFHKDLIMYCMKEKFNNPYKSKLDTSTSIPKIIHYCWFGGNRLPPQILQCISTWKKIMPDYEIKCWNELNFPFEKYHFAQEALKNKKWAFIADVARLHALYYEGGIYLDTDVEVIKTFDEFLDEDGFTSYESLNLIAMAAIGFKKYHPWIGRMLFWYKGIHCDDDYTEIANTKLVSKITKIMYGTKLDGHEKILPCGLHIYPREYFSPKLEKEQYLVTEKTHCIHHFSGLW